MRVSTLCFAVAVLIGCGDEEGDTIDWDSECQSTANSHSCLALEVGTNQYVHDDAVGDLIGALFWALFNAVTAGVG